MKLNRSARSYKVSFHCGDGILTRHFVSCELRQQSSSSDIAGEEYIKIKQNRALCDQLLKFCMVIAMDTRFSKTIANKLRWPSRGPFAQSPLWPPPIKVNGILRPLFALEPCVIPLFQCFRGQGFHL